MGNSIVQLQAATIFQNKQLILKEVSIDVSAGEFVFLIGKTGNSEDIAAAAYITGQTIHVNGGMAMI